MSLTGLRSIILNLPYEVAFGMFGGKLADHIGATPLLYAALAYFVFDESFFLEDLVENYPELDYELSQWLEAFYCDQYHYIEELRKYYATPLFERSSSPRKNIRLTSFRLVSVRYFQDEETVLIAASDIESDHQLGSEWGLPHERQSRTGGYGDDLRRTFRIPGQSGLCHTRR